MLLYTDIITAKSRSTQRIYTSAIDDNSLIEIFFKRFYFSVSFLSTSSYRYFFPRTVLELCEIFENRSISLGTMTTSLRQPNDIKHLISVSKMNDFDVIQ